VLHDCLEGCIGASIAATVIKAIEVLADFLGDGLDAIFGDVHTTRDEKVFQSFALVRDVDECGIRDTDTVSEIDLFDCAIQHEVFVDDADDMLVTQLLFH
jgi:hypothetical protein